MSRLLKALAVVALVWLALFFVQDGIGDWLPRAFNFNIGWQNAARDEILTKAAAGLSGLILETHNGSVRLIGSDRQDLELRVHYRAQANSTRQAEEMVQQFSTQLTPQGDKLQVKADFGTSSYNNQSASYEIYLPADWTVEVNTSNGAVELENMTRSALVDTSNAAVVVQTEAAMKSLSIDTSNGSVDVSVPAGLEELVVDSSNGRISVDGAPSGGKWQLQTSNAEIRITLPVTLGVELDAQTSNAAIKVGSGQWSVSGGQLSSKEIRATRGEGELELYAHTSNSAITIVDR